MHIVVVQCRERLLERLRAAYTSGAVVPLPFLAASAAAPAALLADIRTPYAEVDADTPALVCPLPHSAASQ